ncbi:MAG TPA: hypothetical protein VES68_00230 [Candidatus Sulfotelmatobacter sp.]|nr:hypothetical protein [Candidatus Sulfotelmatobacter sp.]
MVSESDKPFGNLYTSEDYEFLFHRNLDMERTPTQLERIATSVFVRQLKSDIAREPEEALNALKNEIEEIDGLEVHISAGESKDRLFVLTAPPINFGVFQGERRTKIVFQPDLQMRYYPHYFYGLFFDDLPKALYGTGKDAPTASKIRESTIVSVNSRNLDRKDYDLQRLSEKEEFEDRMISSEDIRSVKFTCDGGGVSYSLALPNPKMDANSYIQFSYPSMRPITQDTVDVLLGVHKEGGSLNGDNKSYAKSFASAINRISDKLRVR